jgi:hypothetical protein
MPVLLSNVAATGQPVQWDGGTGLFSLAGTVGGATITLQYLGPDGSTWLTGATALTAVGVVSTRLPPGRVRALVAGGAPSGLYANLDYMKP